MSDGQISFRKSANVDHVTDKRKDSLFRLVDTDGSGTIDAQEFAVLYDAIKKDLAEELEKEAALQKEASSARRRVKMLLLFVAVLVSFLAASVAANFAVIFTVVDQAITTTTTASGLLEVKGSDKIAKTAIATQDVPLVVAPALDMETLSNVQSLRVTYSTGTSGRRVEAQLAVVGVRRHNSTFVEFLTDVAGETVETLNGIASLVRYPTEANRLPKPRKFAICSANATCSAFRASGVDMHAALELAKAELESNGFHDAARRLALAPPVLAAPDYGPCPLYDPSLWILDDCDDCAGDGAVVQYYTANDNLPAHVVFVLHGSGSNGNNMYNIYAAAFQRIEFTHLVFVFPHSGITAIKHNGNPTAGWCANFNDSATYAVGMAVLVETLCGGPAWTDGEDCGEGPLYEYGVTAQSQAFAVGFSNGGAMAIWAGWYYGDYITGFSAVDYQPEFPDQWMPQGWSNPASHAFAGSVYYACDSPSYSNAAVFSDDPTELTFGSSIDGSFAYPYLDIITGHGLDTSEFPGGFTFISYKWTATNGRFFKYAVHGTDLSGACVSNAIPNDYTGAYFPPAWGNWNIHLVVPAITRSAVVDDILDWVGAPPPYAPAPAAAENPPDTEFSGSFPDGEMSPVLGTAATKGVATPMLVPKLPKKKLATRKIKKG